MRGRLDKVRFGKGPKPVLAAVPAIDDLLAGDGAAGRITQGGVPLFEFPGRHRPVEVVTGPAEQAGTPGGETIQIGGRAVTINVPMQSGGVVVKCVASKTVAHGLARHIIGGPVRVSGSGAWVRWESGEWAIRKFVISELAAPDETPRFRLLSGLREQLTPPQAGRQNSPVTVGELRAEDGAAVELPERPPGCGEGAGERRGDCPGTKCWEGGTVRQTGERLCALPLVGLTRDGQRDSPRAARLAGRVEDRWGGPCVLSTSPAIAGTLLFLECGR